MMYVVQMQSMKKDSEHSYVLGVFNTRKTAQIAAKVENRSRSKRPYLCYTAYEPTIIPVEMNRPLTVWTVEDWDSPELQYEKHTTSNILFDS